MGYPQQHHKSTLSAQLYRFLLRAYPRAFRAEYASEMLLVFRDALCGVLEDDDLRAIVEHYSPDESVQHLIERANEEGGPDNITAIVVRVA